MTEEELRERLIRAEAAHVAALTCNKLITAAAVAFVCIALLLSGALGFVLGRQRQSKQQTREGREFEGRLQVEEEGEQRQGSVTQDPAENVLQPRLGSQDALKPMPSSHVQDLDSAKLASKEGVEPTVQHRQVSAEDHKYRIYDNYISRWQDNASPWGQPTLGRESRLGSRIGSRVASYTSDASVRTKTAQGGQLVKAIQSQALQELMWQSSLTAEKYQPGITAGDSNLSGVSTQLLYANWEICSSQIKFCYTSKGELISLSAKEEGSQVNLLKAVLDGKQDVAVRALKLTQDVFPSGKLREIAIQQLSLNGVQQLSHFYGICRTEGTIMLVYEFVEGWNMREAIRRNPTSLGWYTNGKVVARDVAQGLAFLHSRKMEHRSFKSTRIMVRSSDWTAKIVDAGLQGITRYCQQSRSKQLAAAFEWAAPELLLGERCGPEADMFGFGVALWELVTQEMPIRGALRDVHAPDECPAAVKSLITKCMAREPGMRPTAEEAVATIQRAWNATPGARCQPDVLLEKPGLLRKRSLRSAHSQPMTPTFTPRQDKAQHFSRPFDERRWDSASEIVHKHSGVLLRKGTLISAQSDGAGLGTVHQPKQLEGKPPPSPHSSPEAHRRVVSPEGRRCGSLDAAVATASRLRPFQTQQQAQNALTSSRRSSPVQRFMSSSPEVSDADDKRQQERLQRERKRRARTLQGAHSAPNASQKEGGGDTAHCCKPAVNLNLSTKRSSSKAAASSPAQGGSEGSVDDVDAKTEKNAEEKGEKQVQSEVESFAKVDPLQALEETLLGVLPVSSLRSDPACQLQPLRTEVRDLRVQSAQELSRPEATRVERWRQKCDATFTSWLGPVGSLGSGDESARRVAFARIGSRFPSFRQQHGGSIDTAAEVASVEDPSLHASAQTNASIE